MANTIIAGRRGAEQTFGDFYFKPNMELLNQVLAGKQQDYNNKVNEFTKVKAKIDEVAALEGWDKERHALKQKEYESLIGTVTNLYDGDLTKADAEFNDLLTTVGKDFGKHGEFTAIGSRHAGYMANYKDVSERLKKGEITTPQAYGLTKELKRSKDIGIGKDPLSWNSWRDVNLINAVDRADFIQKFTEKFKKDAVGKWGPGGATRTTPEGIIEWRKDTHKWISYDEVLKTGKQALRTELGRTGELEAEWTYDQDVRGTTPSTKYYNEYLGKTQGELTKYKENYSKLNALKGKPLQEAINAIAVERIGKPLIKVDGLVGTTTKAARDHLLQILQGDIDNTQVAYDNVVDKDPLTVATALMKEKFLNKLLTDEVHPYAERTAIDEYDQKLKTMKNPVWAFHRKLDLLRVKSSYAFALYDHQFRKEHPFDLEERLDAGSTLIGDTPDMTALGKVKEDLLGMAGVSVDGFFQQIADSELNPDNTRKYSEKDQVLRDEAFRKNQEKLGFDYKTISDARGFENRDGKLIAIDKDGVEHLLSPNSDLNPEVLYESQRQLQNINNQMNTYHQMFNEAHASELADLNQQYSPEDIDFLNNKAQKENDADSDLRIAYDDYVKYNTEGFTIPGLPGMEGPLLRVNSSDVLDYKDWKQQLLYSNRPVNHTDDSRLEQRASSLKYQAKATKDPKEAAALLKTAKAIEKTRSHRKYFLTHKGVINKYNDGMNNQMAKRNKTILSGKSSNRIYIGDGCIECGEARQIAMNKWFHNQENTNSIPFILNDPDTGVQTTMTMKQFIEKVEDLDGDKTAKYTYKLGAVLGDDIKDAFTMPITVYKLDDKGKETKIQHLSGTARSGYDNHKMGYMNEYLKDSKFKMAKQLRRNNENGLEKTLPINGYSNIANKPYSYVINLSKDMDNPDGHDVIKNSTIKFNDFPIVELLPGGYFKSMEKVKNAKGKVELAPTVSYYNKRDPYGVGAKKIIYHMERNEISKDLSNAGVREQYFREFKPLYNKTTGKPILDKEGYQKYETLYYSKYLKLAELILRGQGAHPNELAGEARRMGLDSYQIDKVLKIRTNKIQYRTANRIHPSLLQQPGTQRITNRTFKFTN